jgi:hypothetical protein
MSGIKNVFGAHQIQRDGGFSTQETLEELYIALERGDCKIIDTATRYDDSEELLGASGASKRLVRVSSQST